jgi:hypothetical protein
MIDPMVDAGSAIELVEKEEENTSYNNSLKKVLFAHE